jgi:hypothetical protein
MAENVPIYFSGEDPKVDPTKACTLSLLCKDCHQPVSDSENNAYRLVAGVLYGWCNECFNKHQRRLKYGGQSVPPAEPATAQETVPSPSNRN